MSTLNSATLQKLTEAIRIMHSHGYGELHERLFQGVGALYENTCCSFEIYGRQDGSHYIRENVPFPESRRAAILQRVGEVVPFEHPAFPRLLKGESSAMRLSDLTCQRALRRTHLYNEVFREAEVEHQLIVPVHGPAGVGALTMNRGGKDFSDEDLLAASLLAPQLATAYESNLLLKAIRPATKEFGKTDFRQLRQLGLSLRQCEVLFWIAQGKRDSEIAIILRIGVRTVNVHVRTILAKLGVETRTSAVALVMQRGLL